MTIKFLWYLFSLLTLFSILISSTSNNKAGNNVNQVQLFNINSGRLLIQRFITFSVFMFFLFSILLLFEI